MWQFLKDNQFIVGALSGSLASYLIGLLVSHLRREKRWLGYSIESRNIVKVGDSRISMRFESRDIRRLDSHTVIIRNIGNRPLSNVPVRIVAPDGAEVVDYEFETPDGAKFTENRPTASEIVVSCDLLNPGEAAAVGLTVADSQDSDIKVLARVEGLTVRRIGERSTTTELLELLIESSFIWRATIYLTSALTSGRRLTRR